MRARLLFLVLLPGLALVLAACDPVMPPGLVFTSADSPGGARENYGPDLPADGDDEEGGGEAREIVEPDVIRRDGNLLYVLNQYRGLTIVDLDAAEVLSQTPTAGFPRDLYLVGNRAYVLVGYAQEYLARDDGLSFNVGSRLHVLDLSDPRAPVELGSSSFEGDFVDSRLVGDILYAVSADYDWSVGDGGVTVKQQTSETWVSSIDVADPGAIQLVDANAFEGFGTVIHVTSTAMFVAIPDWNRGATEIQYLDISSPTGDIVLRGRIDVPGEVADRFKLDAFEGVLRVVSSTWWPNREVFVTTIALDDPQNLVQLGQTAIEGARGETLFATRFDGDRAYVVTYLLVDPLFVIDLEDPANPRVAGELIVPGWSTHIEPMGDRLLALGVDDTDGRRVSVSLFDVANPAAPALLDRASFGQHWAWSPAYDDVKALTILDDLVLVPFSGWEEISGAGFDRLQFLRHDRDTLTLEGYVDVQGAVVRSFEYNGEIFALTQEELAAIDTGDLAAPRIANAITLAEYVADVQPLPDGSIAQIVTLFGQGETTVRLYDENAAPRGAVTVPIQNIVDSAVTGTTLVLVASEWEESGFYELALVDCTLLDAPQVTDHARIDVQPWYGGYGFYDGGPGIPEGRPVLEAAGEKKDAIAPWFWWWGSSRDPLAFVSGNTLALRCIANPGQAPWYIPGEGLALVALEDIEAAPQVLELDFDQVAAVQQTGEQLIVSGKDSIGNDRLNRPIAAWYVQAIALPSREVGARVNVPGSLVQYDPAADLLVLEDAQYENFFSVERTLRTVQWAGGPGVVPVDELSLPQNAGAPLGRGRIYYEVFDSTYTINSVLLDESGQLSRGATIAPAPDAWGWLLGAREDNLFVVLAGRVIAAYDFSGANPALDHVVDVMNSPLRLRFSETAAFAPLGYAGAVVIPIE